MTQAYYHNPELRRIGSNLTRALLGDANTDRAVAGARYDTARAVGEETKNRNRQTLINNPELVGQWFAQQEGPGGIDYSQQPRDVLGALMGEYLQNPENLSLGRQRQLKTQPEVRKLGSEAGAADALRDERAARANILKEQLQGVRNIRNDPEAAKMILQSRNIRPEGPNGQYSEAQIESIQNMAGWVLSSDNPSQAIETLLKVPESQLDQALTQEKTNVQKKVGDLTEAKITQTQVETYDDSQLSKEKKNNLIAERVLKMMLGNEELLTQKGKTLVQEELAKLKQAETDTEKTKKTQVEVETYDDSQLSKEKKKSVVNKRLIDTLTGNAELTTEQGKQALNDVKKKVEEKKADKVSAETTQIQVETADDSDLSKQKQRNLETQRQTGVSESAAKVLTEGSKKKKIDKETDKVGEEITQIQVETADDSDLSKQKRRNLETQRQTGVSESAAKVLTEESKKGKLDKETDKVAEEITQIQVETFDDSNLTKAKTSKVKSEERSSIAESAAKVLTETEKKKLVKLQQKTEKNEALTKQEKAELVRLQQKTESEKADKLDAETTKIQVETFDDSNYKQAQTNRLQSKLPFEIEALQALTKQRKANTKSGGYDQKDIKTFVDLWNNTSGAVPNFDLIPEKVSKKLGNAALRNWVPVIGTGADPVGAFDQAMIGKFGSMMDAPVPIGSSWGSPEFYAPANIFNELKHDIKNTPGLLNTKPGDDGGPSQYDIVKNDLIQNQGFTEDQAITLIEAASK